MFLYVDPTAGGVVLQVLLSGFVGGFVIIKLAWHNITNFVLRRSDLPEPGEETAEETATPVS